MEYLLLIYAEEARVNAMSKDQMQSFMGAFQAYSEALGAAGVIRGGNRLRDVDSANTVRIVDGKTTVLNGPYPETREQLGGYYLIDVPDLATAHSWAARCPGAAVGTIEVRPVWSM